MSARTQVSRELWLQASAGASPSSIRRSARPTDCPGGACQQLGYTVHAGLAPATIATGDVLMARLREGRANSIHKRDCAWYQPSCGKRWGGCARGARGQLTVRADRLLHPKRAPSAASHALLHHHPPAQKPAQSIEAMKMPGRRFPTGSTAPPMWPRSNYTPFLRLTGPTPGSSPLQLSRLKTGPYP